MTDNFGMMEVNKILYRYQELMASQYNYAIEWQELADYILPRKNSILVQRIPGWKRTQRLFDSTAPDYLEKLAASIHSTLTPSFTKWFHLEMEDQDLNSQNEVKEWLEMITKKINAGFNKSNFNSEVHEMFLDLIAFGTGCLYEDEKNTGNLHFTCVPIGKYVVGEDADGRVDTLYRSFVMSLHAIVTKWGEEVLPPEILEKSKNKPDQPYEIIHAVYPTQTKNFQNFMWDSVYILYQSRSILSKNGYYNFPYHVPRWTKYSDETYGRGPSHTALPDIRTLNKLVEMELRAIAKTIDPPLGSVMGDVLGPARMIPGGMTAVRNKDSIFPINTGYNFQVANLKKEELRESIKQIYYADQLQMTTGPQMTATEVNVRFELMQRILGPVLGRLEAEFTKPLLNRTFSIFFRSGLFNPIPQQLLMARGNGKALNLRIVYQGSLARAQKSSDVSAIQQFEQITSPILQSNQDASDVIDYDAAIRHIADVLDVPAKVVRDKRQVEKIRNEKQKVQEAQQQMEQMQQTAEAGKKVAPLMRVLGERHKPGSILSKVS